MIAVLRRNRPDLNLSRRILGVTTATWSLNLCASPWPWPDSRYVREWRIGNRYLWWFRSPR